MTERWRWLDLDRQGPYENAAVMPVLVRSVATHGEPIAQTSVWGETHLNVGWFDDVDSTLDLARCDELGIGVVRRSFYGGGTAYYEAECSMMWGFLLPKGPDTADLDAIKTQFHHLVRTVPGNGRLIVNGEDTNLADVLDRGAWTPVTRFAIDPAVDADWRAELIAEDGSAFRVLRGGEIVGEARWSLLGRHSVMNALAALAACDAVGIDVASLLPKLGEFQSVARRLQRLGEHDGIHVIDDFAHHPTAIQTTIDGLRRQIASAGEGGRLIAVLEPRSNSMRLGAHAAALAPSLADADLVRFLLPANLPWDAEPVIAALRDGRLHRDSQALIDDLLALARPGDRVLFMSNGGFDGVPRRFLAALSSR